ncbi:hypothetical protein FQR65_LT02794 [Abscondita terminalis]|nr:hypothetical protein FQR65_LT02794 [Abscondita terminalis]
MSGHKCVYISCGKSPRKYPGLRMFRFPTKDEIRLRKWVTNSGNDALVGLSEDQLRNKYICEHHFSPEYLFPGRKLMLRNAVPKNFLGLEEVLTVNPTTSRVYSSTTSLVYSEIEKYTGEKNAKNIIQDAVINYLNASANESENNNTNQNAVDTQIIIEILKPRVKKPIICVKGASTTNKTLSSTTVKQEPTDPKTETQKETGDFLYDSFMRFYHITKNMPEHVQSRITEKISLLLEKEEALLRKMMDVNHVTLTSCTTTQTRVSKNAEKTIQDAVMKYLNEITSRESTTTTNKKLTNGNTTQIIVEILKPRTNGKKPTQSHTSKLKKIDTTSQSATITQQPIKTETQLHGVDSLYDFCIGIYDTTKKLPKHVQNKVREKISALLKDEEEQLIKNDNVQCGSSSTSSVANNPFTLSDNFVAIKTEIPEAFSESCFSTDSETFDTFVEKYEPV